MKKINSKCLGYTLVCVMCFVSVKESHAQSLGATLGNNLQIGSMNGATTNNFINRSWLRRDANGNDWLTARLHDGISIDVSFQTPGSDTRTWWERDPHHNIQSWGHANATYLTINGGNVGIGTTTPQAKLAVNGNILAKEVKVKTDITVPDYVFEEVYKLPDLKELEAYVKLNKHLPEIPSAAEMGRDGLDLAAMNLLLLKKVEELTLYLFEKDRQVLHLESSVRQMALQLKELLGKDGKEIRK